MADTGTFTGTFRWKPERYPVRWADSPEEVPEWDTSRSPHLFPDWRTQEGWRRAQLILRPRPPTSPAPAKGYPRLVLELSEDPAPPLLVFRARTVMNQLARLQEEAKQYDALEPDSPFRKSVLGLAREYTPVVHTSKPDGWAFIGVGPRTTAVDWAILAWRVHTVYDLAERIPYQSNREILEHVQKRFVEETNRAGMHLGVGLFYSWPISLWYEVYSALEREPSDIPSALARYLLGCVEDYKLSPPEIEKREQGKPSFRFPSRMGLGEWVYLHLAEWVIQGCGRLTRCEGCGKMFVSERQGRVCSERCKKRVQRAKP